MDGTFSSVGAMFVRRDTLEVYVVLGESIFEVVGALIVEDMKLGRMALAYEKFMSLFPGMMNAGGFAIWDGNSMDRVCVMMVEEKNVLIAMTRLNREFPSLVGI